VDLGLFLLLKLVHTFNQGYEVKLALEQAAIEAVGEVASDFLAPDCRLYVAFALARISQLVHVDFAALSVVLGLH